MQVNEHCKSTVYTSTLTVRKTLIQSTNMLRYAVSMIHAKQDSM